MHIQIVLFDGFDLLDALAPYEVFVAAGMYAGGAIEAELVTAEGARAVPSGANGLTVQASGRLNPERAGIILVPGASGQVEGDGPDSVPAILHRAMNSELTGLIARAMDRQDVTVATVCGGSLVLAMSGLLEGRSAVTNAMGMELLAATGAVPVPARVVVDGNLVTGGGVTSGLDVALYLVERELGPRIAHAVERLFEFERRGTVWRASGLAIASAPPTTADEEPSSSPQLSAMPTSPPLPSAAPRASIFDGDWDTTIATPVGKMQVKLRIKTKGGTISGTATQGDETMPFTNPIVQGDKLSWSQQITKPMRLNLKFEVTVQGDDLTGTAKAGLLPASKITGKRIFESR